MRVLFISKECESIGIAQKIVEEGHKVRFWCQLPNYELTGYNLVERVEAWRPSLGWADFAVVDTVGFGRYKKVFKQHGIPVLSCSNFADMAELDRKKGLEMFKKAGINVPDSWFFQSPDDFRLDEEVPKENIAIKPCGNIDTQLTYVCKDSSSVDYALHTYGADQSFLVQKLIEGIEISTEGWWNGRRWVEPFNHTIEQKRFLEGDLGTNTGCQGNIVWSCGEDGLVKETLLKLTEFLKKTDYVGPVDINCIVNEDGVFALEPTIRLGYDAIEALCEGLKEPVLDLLFEVAAGTKSMMQLSNDFLIAVRVSVPPWPQSDYGFPAGRPVGGLNEGNLKHIYLTDVYKDRTGVCRCAQGDGVLMKVTARGRTVNEARRRAYRTINNLSVLDVQYRRDIGLGVERKIRHLKSLGYL